MLLLNPEFTTSKMIQNSNTKPNAGAFQNNLSHCNGLSFDGIKQQHIYENTNKGGVYPYSSSFTGIKEKLSTDNNNSLCTTLCSNILYITPTTNSPLGIPTLSPLVSLSSNDSSRLQHQFLYSDPYQIGSNHGMNNNYTVFNNNCNAGNILRQDFNKEDQSSFLTSNKTLPTSSSTTTTTESSQIVDDYIRRNSSGVKLMESQYNNNNGSLISKSFLLYCGGSSIDQTCTTQKPQTFFTMNDHYSEASNDANNHDIYNTIATSYESTTTSSSTPSLNALESPSPQTKCVEGQNIYLNFEDIDINDVQQQNNELHCPYINSDNNTTNKKSQDDTLHCDDNKILTYKDQNDKLLLKGGTETKKQLLEELRARIKGLLNNTTKNSLFDTFKQDILEYIEDDDKFSSAYDADMFHRTLELMIETESLDGDNFGLLLKRANSLPWEQLMNRDYDNDDDDDDDDDIEVSRPVLEKEENTMRSTEYNNNKKKKNALTPEELTESILAAIPRTESGDLLSYGSIGHTHGTCKACVFFHNSSNTCQNGPRCLFCHYPHATKKRLRLSKKRRAELKQLNQEQQGSKTRSTNVQPMNYMNESCNNTKRNYRENYPIQQNMIVKSTNNNKKGSSSSSSSQALAVTENQLNKVSHQSTVNNNTSICSEKNAKNEKQLFVNTPGDLQNENTERQIKSLDTSYLKDNWHFGTRSPKKSLHDKNKNTITQNIKTGNWKAKENINKVDMHLQINGMFVKEPYVTLTPTVAKGSIDKNVYPIGSSSPSSSSSSSSSSLWSKKTHDRTNNFQTNSIGNNNNNKNDNLQPICTKVNNNKQQHCRANISATNNNNNNQMNHDTSISRINNTLLPLDECIKTHRSITQQQKRKLIQPIVGKDDYDINDITPRTPTSLPCNNYLLNQRGISGSGSSHTTTTTPMTTNPAVFVVSSNHPAMFHHHPSSHEHVVDTNKHPQGTSTFYSPVILPQTTVDNTVRRDTSLNNNNNNNNYQHNSDSLIGPTNVFLSCVANNQQSYSSSLGNTQTIAINYSSRCFPCISSYYN